MEIMEVLAIIGVIALVILIFFIVQTLIVMQSTMKKLDLVLMETELKLRKLSSFMNTIDNLTDIAEKESEKLKNKYEYKKNNEIEKDLINSEELATWLISSMKLGVNFFKKR